MTVELYKVTGDLWDTNTKFYHNKSLKNVKATILEIDVLDCQAEILRFLAVNRREKIKEMESIRTGMFAETKRILVLNSSHQNVRSHTTPNM